jgi:hypothetical protein
VDRVTAINKSLRGFIGGLFGLLPFIGLVPGFYALWCWASVRYRFTDWNPASAYLEWGAMSALLGFLTTLLAYFLIGYGTIERWWS